MSCESESPFLQLPRELRDQVYGHLLPDGPSFDDDNHPHELSPLSILRVNRQIHSETTALLYSSKFTLDVRISRHPFGFEVTQSSPWEYLGYFAPPLVTHGSIHPTLSEPSNPDRPPRGGVSTILPASRYRTLIRRIRVNLFNFLDSPNSDMWTEQWVQEHTVPHEFDSHAALLALSPILHRLREVLVSNSVVLEIAIDPDCYLYDSLNQQFKIYRNRNSIKWRLEMAYILTLGPWKSEIVISKYMAERYPEIKDEVFEQCAQREVFRPASMDAAIEYYKENAINKV